MTYADMQGHCQVKSPIEALSLFKSHQRACPCPVGGWISMTKATFGFKTNFKQNTMSSKELNM